MPGATPPLLAPASGFSASRDAARPPPPPAPGTDRRDPVESDSSEMSHCPGRVDCGESAARTTQLSLRMGRGALLRDGGGALAGPWWGACTRFRLRYSRSRARVPRPGGGGWRACHDGTPTTSQRSRCAPVSSTYSTAQNSAEFTPSTRGDSCETKFRIDCRVRSTARR